MPFPIAAALAVFSALKGGGGPQGPQFELPQFNPGLRNLISRGGNPIMSALAPGATASGKKPDDEENGKTKTKDYILQAFLGSIAQSAFGPKQPSPYTFSPPTFR